MLPPRIADGFKNLPGELVGLCRPHTWEQLITPPAEGMRPIRDVLVHLIEAEAWWIRHVLQGHPGRRLDPTSFGDLDRILVVWAPQRNATLTLLHGLTPQERLSRRPLPWNPAETASVEEIVWCEPTTDRSCFCDSGSCRIRSIEPTADRSVRCRLGLLSLGPSPSWTTLGG